MLLNKQAHFSVSNLFKKKLIKS